MGISLTIDDEDDGNNEDENASVGLTCRLVRPVQHRAQVGVKAVDVNVVAVLKSKKLWSKALKSMALRSCTTTKAFGISLVVKPTIAPRPNLRQPDSPA